MTPKVSVCMISYRHAAFIAQAIESVLAQQCDFEIELVIGDDRSPDGTGAICDEFARRDPRVRLLPRDRNLGVMANFSRTLQACRGEYVAVCEGDDYWIDPLKLAKQVAFLDAHPDHAAATHQARVVRDGEPPRLFRENVPVTLGTPDLIGGRLFHTASVLFRRPVVDTFAAAPTVLSCDRLLNLCMSFAGKVHYSEEPMCAYRLHGAGMSSTVTVAQLKMDLDSIPFLKRLNPAFPAQRYRSYVYTTIGLCMKATLLQRVGYLFLAFVLSFAAFPHNLSSIAGRLRRLRASRATGSTVSP
jgi:glycosyltransferase involved in cell wall biosynthesis